MLRDPNAVELQTAQFLHPSDPRIAALVERSMAGGRAPTLCTGLKGQTDSIAVVLAPPNPIKARRYG